MTMPGYYDEEGNEISFLEASRRYLTDGISKVVVEYVPGRTDRLHGAGQLRGDELLELKAFAL